ncbi:hypothetical protein CEUSTIGMA_g4216.t1, partial [Chlamydomonas eustigma]
MHMSPSLTYMLNFLQTMNRSSPELVGWTSQAKSNGLAVHDMAHEDDGHRHAPQSASHLPPLESPKLKEAWKGNTIPHGVSHHEGYSPEAPSSPALPAPRPVSWGQIGGTGPLLLGKKVHVQALARNKSPEELANEVVQLKEQLYRLQEQQRISTTERRRLEAQMMQLRGNVQKAEELLNERERASTSPSKALSQMYRNPETTSLVTNLKERVRALVSSNSHLSEELHLLKNTMRATHVHALEDELSQCKEELKRQGYINAAIKQRLVEAEEAADSANNKAGEAVKALREYMEVGSLPPSPSVSRITASHPMSNGKLKSTLAVLRQGHDVLISQAQAIRFLFPPGLTYASFVEKAAEKSTAAGAPDVLNYLRVHIKKMVAELAGMPGDERYGSSLMTPASQVLLQAADTPAEEADVSKSRVAPSSPSRKTKVGRKELARTLTEVAQRLASMQPEDFIARGPYYMHDMDAIAELAAQIYWEVRRLKQEDGEEVPVQQQQQHGKATAAQKQNQLATAKKAEKSTGKTPSAAPATTKPQMESAKPTINSIQKVPAITENTAYHSETQNERKDAVPAQGTKLQAVARDQVKVATEKAQEAVEDDYYEEEEKQAPAADQEAAEEEYPEEKQQAPAVDQEAAEEDYSEEKEQAPVAEREAAEEDYSEEKEQAPAAEREAAEEDYSEEKEQAPAADQEAEPAAEEAEKVAEPAAEEAENITEQKAEEPEKLAETAAKEPEKVAEPAAEEAENVAEPADDEAEKVTEPAAEEAKTVAEPAAEEAEKVAEPAADEAEKVTEPAAEEAKTVAESAAEEAEKVAEEAEKEAEQAAEEDEKVAEPAAEEAEEVAEPSVEEAEKVTEPAAEEAKKVAEEAVKEVERETEKKAEEVKKVAEPAAEEAEKVAEPAVEEAEKVAEQAVEEAVTVAEPSAEEAEKEAEPAVVEVEKVAEPTAGEAEDVAEPGAEEAKTVAEPAAEEAKKVAEEAEKEAEKETEEVKKVAESAAEEAEKVAEPDVQEAEKVAEQAVEEAVTVAEPSAEEAE